LRIEQSARRLGRLRFRVRGRSGNLMRHVQDATGQRKGNQRKRKDSVQKAINESCKHRLIPTVRASVAGSLGRPAFAGPASVITREPSVLIPPVDVKTECGSTDPPPNRPSWWGG